jgi:hypothetical protein
MPSADQAMFDEGESVTAARIEVGDIITLPGASAYRCRVQMVRSAVPGVVWLYLVDSTTGRRLRGHVAVPLNQKVARHSTRAPGEPDRIPDDG